MISNWDNIQIKYYGSKKSPKQTIIDTRKDISENKSDLSWNSDNINKTTRNY